MDGRKYLRDLTTVEVPLGQLHGYEGNAKEHTRGQLDAVEASIREFGFSNPVLAWHDADGRAVIVAGHARCEAARALGMERVPAIFLDGLTDAQRRALTLADNQTTMMTGWDAEQLAEELDALAGEFDMGDFGFDLGDGGDAPDLDAIDEVEPDDSAQDRVSRGDVWALGAHRLVCGDATSPEDMAKLARGGVVRPAADRPSVQRGAGAAHATERGQAASQTYRRPGHRQRQLGR